MGKTVEEGPSKIEGGRESRRGMMQVTEEKSTSRRKVPGWNTKSRVEREMGEHKEGVRIALSNVASKGIAGHEKRSKEVSRTG